MYYFFSLFTGVLIAMFISSNGELSVATGVYSSTVIIHIVGLVTVSIALAIKRINPFINRQPWHLYIAGVLGVLSTAGNNYAFEYLGVSAILGLGLLGQTLMGILVDQFGLFGMKVYKFQKKRLVGFTIMLVGIFFMIREFQLLAVILSTATGAVLVIQRSVNGKLSSKTSLATSTIFTYIIGLLCGTIMLLIFGQGEPMMTGTPLPSGIWIYTGGAFGAVTVFLSTVCVKKISSYSLSVLMFIGQVFTGVAIDSMILGSVSVINLVGGAIVSAGLCVDLALNKKQ